ncbi:TPA: hypothetical protein ACGUO9_004209 [Vibrio vulnificus]
MKKLIIAMGLSLLASSAVANVDPVVSEYQKIDALQKLAPSLSEVLIAVNARTATGCEMISPFDSLVKYEEVIGLAAYVKMQGGMDGSEELVQLLDKATIAVCQSLISNMVEKPKAMSQLQKELSHITSKYSLAVMSGVDSETASKQLNDDYSELRSKYLGQNENSEKWTQLKLDYYQSMACGDLSSSKADQKCLDLHNHKLGEMK